jgi:hypothetical protein
MLAVALIGAGGLTMTQFAATQETQPEKKADAKQKADAKAPQKGDEKATPARKGLSIFMRMKLEASQKILAGLALEDFELIQEGANKLEEMSAAEKWRVTNDPFFREHSADFQQIAKRLSKNAKDGKLDASALTWLEATMQCIECHKWTRANLIARQPER